MLLTDLSLEVLLVLTIHCHNIEDFSSLISTCQTLRRVGQTVSPNQILRLCSYSAPTFFSPHPHFLIAATARRLSQTCLGNSALTAQLVTAFQSGIDGLYTFALQHSGITFQELAQWHLARFSAINPLSDRIDKMAGQQWYQVENFWDGGVSEAFTISCESNRAAFQSIIYGELFKGSMDNFLEPSSYSDGKMVRPHFGLDTRLEYVKYCIPDVHCRSYPGLEVGKTGPYASEDGLEADQSALHHVLYCGRWKRMWRGILRQVGPDFWDEEAEEERLETEYGFLNTRLRQAITLGCKTDRIRQLLWWNAAVQTGGIEGMQAVQYGGFNNTRTLTTVVEGSEVSGEVRSYLTTLRRRIENLDEEQLLSINGTVVGKYAQETISEVPDFAKEIGVCMRSLWPGTGGIS